MSPVTNIVNKGMEPTNYPVKLVHFTKAEQPNIPVHFAFEITDPESGIPFIQTGEVNPIELYNWLSENNLLHKLPGTMRTTALRRVG